MSIPSVPVKTVKVWYWGLVSLILFTNFYSASLWAEPAVPSATTTPGITNSSTTESPLLGQTDQSSTEPKTTTDLTETVHVQAAKSTEKQRELFGCIWEDNSFEVALKNRVEVFYSKNCALLSGSPLDQVLWAQGIWDLKTKAKIGKALESYIVLRNKSRWGSPDSIATTSSTTLKLADATFGDHNHYLSKQIFWLREGWVDINLNRTIGVATAGPQHFKAGLFPFELGRGIALGSAYASSAGLLGFYADSTVDQNAPGFLLYGDLAKDKVTYDMYLGILRNWTDSFGRVNEQIYANELNQEWSGARGFGHVNFVYAMRVKWYPMSVKQGDHSTLVIEPYFLYNRNPEVQIEFPADGASNLITPGLMIDYEGEKFQWGCEFAANFGHQTVHGWDSNQIEIAADSSGTIVEQYTQVYSNSALTTKALVSSANKTIVKNYAGNSPDLNGQQINASGLYNGATRFSPSYQNIYRGWMFVTDFSWLISKILKLSGTIGWATGDENPNRDLDGLGDSNVDGDYQGFIGLQEIYSGKRVISLFVIGSNSLVRPLSSISDQNLSGNFPSKATGFTNLVYCGGALTFDRQFCSKPVNWNLGLLSYWQALATKKFSTTLKRSIDEPANKHLGVEFNATMTMQFIKNLKGFLVGGVFLPGKHYQDIKGKAFSKADLAALEKLDEDGVPVNGAPLLNTKTAFVLNFGIEYAF